MTRIPREDLELQYPEAETTPTLRTGRHRSSFLTCSRVGPPTGCFSECPSSCSRSLPVHWLALDRGLLVVCTFKIKKRKEYIYVCKLVFFHTESMVEFLHHFWDEIKLRVRVLWPQNFFKKLKQPLDFIPSKTQVTISLLWGHLQICRSIPCTMVHHTPWVRRAWCTGSFCAQTVVPSSDSWRDPVGLGPSLQVVSRRHCPKCSEHLLGSFLWRAQTKLTD